MNYAVEQRLRLIDFLLAFYGHVGRGELIVYFGIGEATATRDLALYAEQNPDNLVYEPGAKRWVRTANFFPRYAMGEP